VTENDEEDISSYWKALRKKKVLETERGRTRSLSVENSLSRDKRYYRMN